jgi:hypothetical protein
MQVFPCRWSATARSSTLWLMRPSLITRQPRQGGSLRLASASNGAHSLPEVSQRVRDTDAPCIVKTKKLMEGVEGVVSLAQGMLSLLLVLPKSSLPTTRPAGKPYAAAHALHAWVV